MSAAALGSRIGSAPTRCHGPSGSAALVQPLMENTLARVGIHELWVNVAGHHAGAEARVTRDGGVDVTPRDAGDSGPPIHLPFHRRIEKAGLGAGTRTDSATSLGASGNPSRTASSGGLRQHHWTVERNQFVRRDEAEGGYGFRNGNDMSSTLRTNRSSLAYRTRRSASKRSSDGQGEAMFWHRPQEMPGALPSCQRSFR